MACGLLYTYLCIYVCGGCVKKTPYTQKILLQGKDKKCAEEKS